MNNRRKLGILALCLVILIMFFLGVGLNSRNFQYALSRRVPSLIAIILTGGTIAFSTMIFQTVTNNRILTPGVLGLDSLYMLVQTSVLFLLGSQNIVSTNSNINFTISIGFMLLFSFLLFKLIFKREGSNIYFLLLVGLIFGTLFQSLTSFMQLLIDPNEFTIIQDKMFASFNNINTEILSIAIVLVIITIIYSYKYIKILDVLSLGRENAINLGINYDKVVNRMLMVVTVLISVSTALVGPITFLGIIVANLSREFLRTYKHSYLILGSVLISTVALVGGQFIISRLMNFNTTLSVIINFVGGLYFIYLLLKENKA